VTVGRRRGDRTRFRTVASRRAAVLLAAAALALVPATAANGAPGPVQVTIAVNGQPAVTSSDGRPAQIYPRRPAQIAVRIVNDGSAPVSIGTVRFEGSVLDLPLFSYDTAVGLVVPANATRSISFPIDMDGIGTLATGLIVSTVSLIGTDGYTVASQSVVTKVHGSFFSIYGFFALAVLALTISSLVIALIMLFRHRLPQNRWLRGVRFFVPGFGVGLILTFTLAAAGLSAPGPGHWLGLVVIPSVAGLALGLLTPAPDEDEFDDYDEDVLLAEIVMVDDDPLKHESVLRASADPARATAQVATAVPDGRSTAVT